MAPPACWVESTNARQRLQHACTMLRCYGVAACSALPGEPEVTRLRLHRAVLARFAHAEGAYLFWSVADDHTHFNPDGDLIAPLTLYLHGKHTDKTVSTALNSVGLRTDEGTQPDTLAIACSTT